MREKLLDLMKNEGLKPSQLAEMLEINPAGISHILAGRNKPGFDLLQKILRRFPRINPDWLLLDAGQMYRDDQSNVSPSGSADRTSAAENLFSKSTTNEIPFDASRIGGTPDTGPFSPETKPLTASAIETAIATSGGPTAVKRIVILYDDQTFESYTPAKR